MAKRKKSSRPHSAAELEKQIRGLDEELADLVSQRAEMAQQLSQLRKERGERIFRPEEEQAVVKRALGHANGPMPAGAVAAVFREMLSGCRSLVKPLRVVYLGPQHSYSHLAALQRFGHSVDLAPVGTIAAVFEEVNRGQADFGLAPIENTTDGRVVDTLEMFARLPVKICGEVQLRIHHYLLARCSRADVREVYSKPQALSQCRGWLARHLPAARMIEMTSTAAAAQLAADKPGAAAIASRQAAASYGLDVLAENIEDNQHNLTRFAVISDRQAPRTGKDKTSIMFQIQHVPGALADAMAIFKKGGLNLTWIESFPIPGVRSEYLFFVELEGHPNEDEVAKALAQLEKKTLRFELLGAYAKTEPVE